MAQFLWLHGFEKVNSRKGIFLISHPLHEAVRECLGSPGWPPAVRKDAHMVLLLLRFGADPTMTPGRISFQKGL